MCPGVHQCTTICIKNEKGDTPLPFREVTVQGMHHSQRPWMTVWAERTERTAQTEQTRTERTSRRSSESSAVYL